LKGQVVLEFHLGGAPEHGFKPCGAPYRLLCDGTGRRRVDRDGLFLAHGFLFSALWFCRWEGTQRQNLYGMWVGSRIPTLTLSVFSFRFPFFRISLPTFPMGGDSLGNPYSSSSDPILPDLSFPMGRVT